MNGRVGWSELFFSASGRAPRRPSVIAVAVLLGLTALYEALVEDSLSRLLTGWFVYPVLIYCGACILSKRLHDRGRSGWWAALVLVAIAAVWSHPNGFFNFLFFLVLVWSGVELTVLSGERGTNRFGPNPLNPAAPT